MQLAQKKLVLLIESDQSLRELAMLQLCGLGLFVLTADSIDRALQLYSIHAMAIDCVVAGRGFDSSLQEIFPKRVKFFIMSGPLSGLNCERLKNLLSVDTTSALPIADAI